MIEKNREYICKKVLKKIVVYESWDFSESMIAEKFLLMNRLVSQGFFHVSGERVLNEPEKFHITSGVKW